MMYIYILSNQVLCMPIRGAKNQVKSLEKSFRILDCVKERNGLKLNELVDELNYSRSTVHNHLLTLMNTGFVVRENNTYHIGLAFLHYGEYALHRKPEFKLAKEYVEELANKTSEEVDFTVPEQGRLISVYHAVGDRQSSSLQVGSRFHMHHTAAGKAVLAEMSPDEIEEIVEYWGMPADTEHTITSVEELQIELDTIRKRGYAINDEELIEGFRSIGMTVHYPNERILGALSIGGPKYRIDTEPEAAHVQNLQNTVDSFEHQISEGLHNEENWWREFRDSPDQDI